MDSDQDAPGNDALDTSTLPDLPILPDQSGDLLIPLPDPVDDGTVEGTRYRWDEDDEVFHLWIDHGDVEYFPYSTSSPYVQELLSTLLDETTLALVAPKHFPYDSLDMGVDNEPDAG